MKCGDRIQINAEGDMCYITARGASGQRVNVAKKVRGATGRVITNGAGWVMSLDNPIRVGGVSKYEVTLETSLFSIDQFITVLEEYSHTIARDDICVVNLDGYEYSREYGYLSAIRNKEVIIKEVKDTGECMCQLKDQDPQHTTYRWTPTYRISPLFLKKPLCIPLSEYLLA